VKRNRTCLKKLVVLSIALTFSCATADPTAAYVQRYAITPGSEYTYFPSQFAGGIPGGEPSDFELDFGVSGFFSVEYESQTARLLDVEILLSGNEAVQANPPGGTLVTAERVAEWLEGRLMELLPNLPPWDEYADQTHPDFHLLDFGSSVMLQGGYDTRPVDGDGLQFDLGAAAIPEPATLTIVILAAGLFVRRWRCLIASPRR